MGTGARRSAASVRLNSRQAVELALSSVETLALGGVQELRARERRVRVARGRARGIVADGIPSN
jgi:hypothetical protein